MILHRALGCDPGAATGFGVVDVIHGVEHAVAWGVLDATNPAGHLRELLRLHTPASVGIETVERVHPVERRGVVGISTKQALALYESGVVAGMLLREAAVWTSLVHRPTAEQWRKALTRNPHADDDRIARVLRLRLRGFPPPRKSNCHERDGLGVALHTALQSGLCCEVGSTERAQRLIMMEREKKHERSGV